MLKRFSFAILLAFALALAGLNPAQAGSHGQSRFNGGKSQMSWNFAYYLLSGPPFINVFKTGQGWVYQSTGFGVDPSDLDSNGWPLVTSSTLCNNFYPASDALTINNYYFITWTGTATSPLQLAGATVASGNLSTSGVKIQPLSGGTLIQLCIPAGVVVSNINVYSEKYATNVANGETWNPDWLARMRYYNPGVIRFLDQQSGNFGNQSTWAQRRPLTYAYWLAPEPRTSLYAGATTYALNGSSNDYAVNLGAAQPIDKQTVIVKFNANSAGATNTFSIDGGVTKFPMYRPYADALTSSARWPALNRKGTLVFDNDLKGWLKWGGDNQDFDQYLDNGMPFELILDLCVRLGSHPHLISPYLSVDPIQDLQSSQAAYIKANGPSWMIPHFEGVNELWNSQFYGVFYANAKQLVRNGGNLPGASLITYPVSNLAWTGVGSSGTATLTITGGILPPVGAQVTLNGSWTGSFGFAGNTVYVTGQNVGAQTVTVNLAPTGGTSPLSVSGVLAPVAVGGYQDWYGQIMSDMGQAVSAVYGNDRTKYEVLAGVQTGTGSTTGTAGIGTSTSNPRLSAQSYVLRGGSAASNWVTGVANAQYTSPSEYGYNQELVDAFAYAVTNASNPTAQQVIAENYVATLNSGFGNFNLASLATYYANWKSWAQGFGVTHMMGYEGGYSPDFLGLAVTSAVTGATQFNPCVLQLPYTNVQSFTQGSTAGFNINISSASFQATINTAGLLTVSSVGAGTIGVGQTISVSGTPIGIIIDDHNTNGNYSGTGSTGTYHITPGQTLGSTAMTASSTPAAVAGMVLSLASVGGMTQLNNSAAQNITITNGNANIPYTGSASVGQGVEFTNGTGSFFNLANGVAYYIVSVNAGVSIQVSATKGGAAITPSGITGSVTVTTGWVVLSVSGQSVSIDVDATGFSAYTSGGTATYVNAPFLLNTLRNAGRFTVNNGFATTTNYNNFTSAGGTFPSQFLANGQPGGTPNGTGLVGGGTVWSLSDTMYSPITPAGTAVHNFNTNWLLKRDVEPAANDNDPMFLEKAA